LPIDSSAPKIQYQPATQYTGFGSEEDSLQSVKTLNPKAIMKNEKKIFKCDMHILRFECKLVSTEPDDETREFMLSFFCGDDTIQVYEKCDKNAGRLGGKFLQRNTYKNPVTGDNYDEKDFKIGKTIYLNGWRFQIQSSDEYTEKYMEENVEVFPESSVNIVLQKIKAGAHAFPSLQEYAIKLLKELDTNGDGVLGFEEFSNGMK